MAMVGPKAKVTDKIAEMTAFTMITRPGQWLSREADADAAAVPTNILIKNGSLT